MYEELVKRLRILSGTDNISEFDDAADAIAELSMKLHGDEAAIAGMKREIERMVRADKPRWIPVTEALPENGVEVLCWYEYYHWSKGKVMPEYGIGYQFNGHWGGEVSNGRDCRVLAWMPLPEPPEEATP